MNSGRSLSLEESERVRTVILALLKEHGGQSALSRALAQKGLRISQGNLSQVERGVGTIGYRVARDIAQFTGQPVEELISGNAEASVPRWKNLPWRGATIALARKMAPRVSELSWARLGNLMGGEPPTQDPARLAVLATAWDQVSSDDDRAAAQSAQSRAEMAEEDARTDDLLKRRHHARERGEPLPQLPEEEQLAPPPPPPPRRSPGAGRRKADA